MDNKDEKIKEKFKYYSAKLAAISVEVAKEADIIGLQAWMESIAYELGIIDGFCCIACISKEDRKNTKDLFFKLGKQFAIEGHRISCQNPDCEQLNNLKIELNGN